MILSVPPYVVDLKGFVEWLRTCPAPFDSYATALHELEDMAEWGELVGEHVDNLHRDVELGDPEGDGDETHAKLDMIGVRYEAVRNMLSEWHDFDISEPDYAERVEAFGKKTSADDDLVYRVRRGLTKMGVLQEGDSNLYAAQMLTALLGVEFGT